LFMKTRCALLLFFLPAVVSVQGADAGAKTAADAGTVVLSDGVDMDRLILDANGSDPAARAAATKALEGMTSRNPTGKRRLSFGAVSLILPSWQWDYDRKPGIHGIAVDRQPSTAGGDTASILVDRLPGMSEVTIRNALGDLPEGAKVAKTELKAFGTFSGTGVRETVTFGGAAPQRMECVLFYPKGELDGYYVFSLFAGPPAGDRVEAELKDIAKSIRGR
jgi:hypothetical protein